MPNIKKYYVLTLLEERSHITLATDRVKGQGFRSEPTSQVCKFPQRSWREEEEEKKGGSLYFFLTHTHTHTFTSTSY